MNSLPYPYQREQNIQPYNANNAVVEAFAKAAKDIAATKMELQNLRREIRRPEPKTQRQNKPVEQNYRFEFIGGTWEITASVPDGTTFTRRGRHIVDRRRVRELFSSESWFASDFRSQSFPKTVRFDKSALPVAVKTVGKVVKKMNRVARNMAEDEEVKDGDEPPELTKKEKNKINRQKAKVNKKERLKKPHVPTVDEAKKFIKSARPDYPNNPDLHWNFKLRMKVATDRNIRENFGTGYMVYPFIDSSGASCVFSVMFSSKKPANGDMQMLRGSVDDPTSDNYFLTLLDGEEVFCLRIDGYDGPDYYVIFVSIRFSQKHLNQYVPISSTDLARANRMFYDKINNIVHNKKSLKKNVEEEDDEGEPGGARLLDTSRVGREFKPLAPSFGGEEPTLMSKLMSIPKILTKRSKSSKGTVRYYVIFRKGQTDIGNGVVGVNSEKNVEVRTNYHVFKDSDTMSIEKSTGNEKSFKVFECKISGVESRVDDKNDLVSISLRKKFSNLPMFASKTDITSINCLVRASVSGVKIDAKCNTNDKGDFQMKAQPGYSGSGIIWKKGKEDFVIGIAKSYIEGSDSVGVILFTENAYEVRSF